MRGFILFFSCAIFLLFVPEITRNLLFENRGWAASIGAALTFGSLLLSYRDRPGKNYGDQGFGPVRKFIRAILTEDKHAARAASVLFAIFAIVVAFCGQSPPLQPIG